MTAILTARPGGKLYRRLKPIEAEFCPWNDDSSAVIVYGTHDRTLADGLASRMWEIEGDGPLPEPAQVWLKRVPWDALGLGYDSTILEVAGYTKGSTPALRYGGDA